MLRSSKELYMYVWEKNYLNLFELFCFLFFSSVFYSNIMLMIFYLLLLEFFIIDMFRDTKKQTLWVYILDLLAVDVIWSILVLYGPLPS